MRILLTRCQYILQNFKVPKLTVRRPRDIRNVGKKIYGFSSLGLGIVQCDNSTVQESSVPNFSHEHCIKQACVSTVNSATTLLTTTVAAVLDICQKYRMSLLHVISLLQEISLTEGGNSELWDSVVEARATLNKIKASLNELNLFMESVEKLVNSTTETAFLAGTDYMCTALCERLHSAQSEINRNLMELKDLEHDYLKMQQELVKNAKTPENEVENNSIKIEQKIGDDDIVINA